MSRLTSITKLTTKSKIFSAIYFLLNPTDRLNNIFNKHNEYQKRFANEGDDLN